MIERRNNPRIENEVRVTVVLLSVPDLPELNNKQLFCNSSDISLGGICLKTDMLIPVRSIITLSVIIESYPVTYTHTGQVMWCKQNSNQDNNLISYETGIKFTKTSTRQFSDWRTAILVLLERGFK